MNSPIQQHDGEHHDLVFLYALQALPTAEIPAAETHFTGCDACRQELELLRPIVGGFTAWPSDVLRPAQPLWERLTRRISMQTGQEPVLNPPRAPAQPEWETVVPGISVKLLATDTLKNRTSMLVRLDPGTEYPPHCHAGEEELHLLYGELIINNRKLHPGDYFRAAAGSVDHRVWSETGCTCVLITSNDDEIL
ncbi:MAG TPA: cupin domain-containing protein [Terriglobia bacterium]|jgi:anti-sigma factor ChrR (cupin superfamily)